MAEPETKTAPIRLEHEGNLAVIVLDNPARIAVDISY